jgi:hypothetical protein
MNKFNRILLKLPNLTELLRNNKNDALMSVLINIYLIDHITDIKIDYTHTFNNVKLSSTISPHF